MLCNHILCLLCFLINYYYAPFLILDPFLILSKISRETWFISICKTISSIVVRKKFFFEKPFHIFQIFIWQKKDQIKEQGSKKEHNNNLAVFYILIIVFACIHCICTNTYAGGRAPPVPVNVDGDLDDDPFREVRLYTTTAIYSTCYVPYTYIIHNFTCIIFICIQYTHGYIQVTYRFEFPEHPG